MHAFSIFEASIPLYHKYMSPFLEPPEGQVVANFLRFLTRNSFNVGEVLLDLPTSVAMLARLLKWPQGEPRKTKEIKLVDGKGEKYEKKWSFLFYPFLSVCYILSLILLRIALHLHMILAPGYSVLPKLQDRAGWSVLWNDASGVPSFSQCDDQLAAVYPSCTRTQSLRSAHQSCVQILQMKIHTYWFLLLALIHSHSWRFNWCPGGTWSPFGSW